MMLTSRDGLTAIVDELRTLTDSEEGRATYEAWIQVVWDRAKNREELIDRFLAMAEYSAGWPDSWWRS